MIFRPIGSVTRVTYLHSHILSYRRLTIHPRASPWTSALRVIRIETFKQRELSLRPFIVLSWEFPGKFFIRNIGAGAALSIEVDDIYIPRKNESDFEFKFTSSPIDVVAPGEKQELDMKDIQGNTVETFGFGVLQTGGLGFNIYYSNIEGKRCQTYGRFGESGVIVEGTSCDC